MNFSPRTNAAPEPAPTAPQACGVCGTELAWAGRGRRPKYCSKACSSKAERQRNREREQGWREAARTRTENPRRETPLPDGAADTPDAAELLALADRLREQDLAFLTGLRAAVEEQDPARAAQLAQEATRAARSLAARRRELIGRIADSALADLREPAISTRGENPSPATIPAPPALSPIPPRGETDAAPPPAGPQDSVPVPTTRLRTLVDRHLARQSGTDPAPAPAPSPADNTMTAPRSPHSRGLTRATDFQVPLPPRMFGTGWALEGWQGEPNVITVVGAGRTVGWIEGDLPGLSPGQWVAVYGNGFMADAATQDVLVHETPEAAARTVRQAYLQNL